MADLSTKQKILNTAIRLFNENGMANVRLNQIAGEVGISVGNLAYHFKNKDAIIEALNEALHTEATEVLKVYRTFPNLMDFDNQLSKYFAFLEKYPFYFLDLPEIERHYPDFSAKQKVQVSRMISQIRKRFDFNYQREIICEEPRPGLYDCAATTIWVLITFWVPQNFVRGNNDSSQIRSFKEMVWNQFFPYLTEKGKQEFNLLIKPILELSGNSEQ